mgnify:FL=1
MSSSQSTPDDLPKKAGELLKNTPPTNWHPCSSKFLFASTNQPWLIACSGGADSVMVLLLIYALFPKSRHRLTVVHFNHQLRGDDSENDAIFMERVATKLGLAFELGIGGVAIKCDEGTLREQRQTFYRKIINQKGAKVLIQGHNLDDVAETLLWRIPRGVGIEGLCAPRPVQELGNFHQVRPLLTLSRDYIRKALKREGIEWRDDSTNNSAVYLRNRIRKNTLTQWKTDSDRDVLQGVRRTRDLLDEQNAAIEQWAREILQEYCDEQALRVGGLISYPRGLIRKVITLWLVEKMNISIISHSNLDQILDRLVAENQFEVDLNQGFKLVLRSNLLTKNIPHGEARKWKTYSLPPRCKIFLPDGFFLKLHSISLNSALFNEIKSGMVDQKKNAYLLQIEPDEKLYFRRRQRGDRFEPLGSPGSKKVKDWMIDRKWDQYVKETVPLIVNNNNQIMWIPGFPPAKERSINSSSGKVIRLTYHQSSSLC